MKTKNIKYIIAAIITVIIFLLVILIYKNLFADSNNSRNSDIGEYALSEEEISAVKDTFSEINEVEEVDLQTFEDVNSKRISIVVKLSNDVDFETFKKTANKVFSCFSERELNYYDIHITVDTKVSSEIYPKMGTRPTKEEDSLEFNWSR